MTILQFCSTFLPRFLAKLRHKPILPRLSQKRCQKLKRKLFFKYLKWVRVGSMASFQGNRDQKSCTEITSLYKSDVSIDKLFEKQSMGLAPCRTKAINFFPKSYQLKRQVQRRKFSLSRGSMASVLKTIEAMAFYPKCYWYSNDRIISLSITLYIKVIQKQLLDLIL